MKTCRVDRYCVTFCIITYNFMSFYKDLDIDLYVNNYINLIILLT